MSQKARKTNPKLGLGSFKVVWELDWVEAQTPRQAAEQALAVMQEPGTPCNFFKVQDQQGKWHEVDLEVAEETTK